MKLSISIFGLGYVGCVGVSCLSSQGHRVIGVDINQIKLDQINSGKPTIIEKDIDNLVYQGWKNGLISGTSNVNTAIEETTVSFICVGTPSDPNNGHLSLHAVFKVAEEIGKALATKNDFHVVVIRSTVSPGTNAKVGRVIEEHSTKKRNVDFGVVSNPEFLREGTAVDDYFNPELTVIGTDSEKAMVIISSIYEPLNAQIESVPVEVAEIIKYVNNAFHALKIVFANEIGNICKHLNIDSHKVMKLFCTDSKLNISEKYLEPGFAYGGSCLPKDLKGLKALSHDFYLESPIIENIEKSNSYIIDLALKLIIQQQKRIIGLLGLSFKPGTDDLRNSPAVALAEMLIGKGYSIRIYDKNVHFSRLKGTNKQEIERRIPHISKLVTDNLDEIIHASELLVFTMREDLFSSLPDGNPEKIFIDLVRVNKKLVSRNNYHGLSW
jgi:GDP-mannose 6-dehydrogenase